MLVRMDLPIKGTNADEGLHSLCRSVVVGHPEPPLPTGQQVYRVTLPAKNLEGVPGLEEITTVPRNNHWIGPKGTILSYLLEGINEKLLNLVCTYVDAWPPPQRQC